MRSHRSLMRPYYNVRMLEESEEEFAALSHAAKLGDSDAATKVIGHYLPYWMRAAYGITNAKHNGSAEPEDLVQEATLKLLNKWRIGQGPESNTRAYVTAMMRNSYLNTLRSPSSRETSLEELESVSPLPSHDNLQEIDISREIAAVRRAFATLTPDHQTALSSTIIEGQKPADLVRVLDRSAPAVSNLLVRAKQALHRALLIDYLSASKPECSKNAQQLPKRVHTEISEHADEERGISHARSCESCQKNWRRFATVSTTLGVLPLLTISQWSASAPAASADQGDQPQSPVETGNTAGVSPSAGLVPGHQVTMTTGAAVSGAATSGEAVSKALTSTPALIAGLALIVAAVIFFALPFVLDTSHSVEIPNETTAEVSSTLVTEDGRSIDSGSSADTSNPYEAEIDVWMNVGKTDKLSMINTEFSVKKAELWSLEGIRLSLSPDTEFRYASNGLQCTSEGSDVQCLPSQSTDLSSPFVFAVQNQSAGGSFELELEATAEGDHYTGRATGSW